MLNRAQRLMLFKARRTPHCLFSILPLEVIREISEIGRNDTEFNTTLHQVAFGELEKVQAMLNQQNKTKLKELLLLSGTVVTPAGLTVKHVTLLECALGSGDPKMIEMLKSYFSKFSGGEEEKERQQAQYRPCIDAMQNQKPDDLTWLFDIIKKSSLEDVAAEFAEGNKYDPSYQSDLRIAMNKFREEKLNPKVRVITKPRMHCNYQNLKAAYNMLNMEWNHLKVGNNYDKIYLVARQIIGFIQLTELPAYERFIFARGLDKNAAAANEVERSFQFKIPFATLPGSFPEFDKTLIDARSGLGFKAYVNIHGWIAWDEGMGTGTVAHGHANDVVSFYEPYIDQKTTDLQNLCSVQGKKRKRSHCVVC